MGILKYLKNWCQKDFKNLVIQAYGVSELLEQLHGKCELIVASNGPVAEQKPRLDNAGISRYFSRFFISEAMGVNKPDKKFFDIILENIGNQDKSSLLMIGDDLSSDIQGAINVGINSCWFNQKGKENSLGIKPTFTIYSFEELLPFLEEGQIEKDRMDDDFII